MDEDLQKRFNDMVKAVKDATIEFTPNNSQKLKLYAFYKQVAEGDVKGGCPSIVSMVERAKWQAWNAIKGMPKEKAMEGYLNVFTQ